MSEEGKKRRPRRRRHRRSPAGDTSATPGEGGSSRRPRSSGRRRHRAKGRSKATGRRTHRSPGNWWARRWSKSLDGIHVGRRVGHGRTYARQGRVIELEFEKGSATAMVQGSRDAPYLVRMHFTMLSAADWRKVLGALGEDEELGGGLFRGEFPEGAEEVFTSLDLSLFFSGQGDLKAACSCPDPANPCKHVAAVYYALGEEINRDPFLLFRLRGLDRAELMEALASTPAARAAMVAPPTAKVDVPGRDEAPSAQNHGRIKALPETENNQPREEPLPREPQLFWAGVTQKPEEEGDEEVRIPQVSGALAQRLGGFPHWRGDNIYSVVIDQIYRAASQAGLSIYLGESDPEKADLA